MDSRLVLAVLGVSLCSGACKAELGDGLTDASTSPDTNNNVVQDAPHDGTTVLGAWSAPAPIPGASTTSEEDDVTLSASKLELYFKRLDGTDNNLYVMTRGSTATPFGSPAPVTPLNTAAGEESPRLANNDLTMYFGRGGDIYKATRSAIGQPWVDGGPVANFNTAANEKWAAVCDTGYAVVSRANGTNLQDLYEGTVATGTNTLISQLNTTTNEQGTFLSADCLSIYFQSNRVGNQFDIYMATRQTTTTAWSNPSPLPDFNTATLGEEDAWISTDQRTFAYATTVAGNGKDLFLSTR